MLEGDAVLSALNIHFSVDNVSNSKDLGTAEIDHFVALNHELHALAKGSSGSTFEEVILDATFTGLDALSDDSAIVLNDASHARGSVKLSDVQVATVPEPVTYVLMFGSMSIISSTARRRRNDAVGWMASRRREDAAA